MQTSGPRGLEVVLTLHIRTNAQFTFSSLYVALVAIYQGMATVDDDEGIFT